MVFAIDERLLRASVSMKARGQAYDGAVNMSGCIQGVATLVKEIQPAAIHVPALHIHLIYAYKILLPSAYQLGKPFIW